MRPGISKKHSPYNLYKKPQPQGPAIWYARFWDKVKGKYGATRSTGILAEGKKERRSEAEEAARSMLPSIHFEPSPADVLFLDYVASFWTPESPYVKEKALVAKRPLADYYVSMNHDDVKRHLEPFDGFRGILLRELTTGDVLDWQAWAVKKGLKARRINAITSSMRVAVRYAVRRGNLDRDPFRGVGEALETPREKGILSPVEVSNLIDKTVPDPRVKAAVLLGALCGLRRGECRGLLWGDVDTEGKVLHIIHNFVDIEGAKGPKDGSARTVPMTGAVHEALKALYMVAPYQSPSDFVFAVPGNRKTPLGDKFFHNALTRMLEDIGVSGDQQKSRNITFHGLRHTFVTISRMSGLSDIVVQSLAGHKSTAMMEHYSHAGQVIDFTAAREAMESAISAVGESIK